jgi:hypothetical protein
MHELVDMLCVENQDLFHNRCFGHIVNLIVKNRLKKISITIKKVN